MMAVDIVRERFPDLAEFALQRAEQMRERQTLRDFVKVLSTATNETVVKWLLNPPAA